MRADQVGVVDIGVVQVAVRLHLRLHSLDDLALAEDLVVHLDAGDPLERLGEHFQLIGMGRDAFRKHVDLHAGEWLRGIDEPLHLGFLGGAVERGETGDLVVEERLGFVHARIGLAGPEQQDNCCR